MGKPKYPENLPEELHTEYLKYLADPKRYAKLHPVGYQILIKYIRTTDVKEESKRRSTK